MKLYELLIGCAVLFVGCGAVSAGGCGEGYSEGERIGTITKFSRKGLAVKSYEGEMFLGGIQQTGDGTMANVWAFHAKDALAPKLETAASKGSRVKVKYRQWAVKPFGQDSSYDVVSVEPVAEEK